MIDHAAIDRHFAVDLFCEAARMDVAKQCKAHIETVNRSFGQMIRQHKARMLKIMEDDENLGDEDLLCCSGLAWGDQ